MGCAECRLLRMLKREPYIEELVGVDYDGVLLRMSEHVVQPLTTDYLMPRDNPLQFTLMQGVLFPSVLFLVTVTLLVQSSTLPTVPYYPQPKSRWLKTPKAVPPHPPPPSKSLN